MSRRAMVCIYNAAPGINITCFIAYVQPLFDMEELNPEKTILAKTKADRPSTRQPFG